MAHNASTEYVFLWSYLNYVFVNLPGVKVTKLHFIQLLFETQTSNYLRMF